MRLFRTHSRSALALLATSFLLSTLSFPALSATDETNSSTQTAADAAATQSTDSASDAATAQTTQSAAESSRSTHQHSGAFVDPGSSKSSETTSTAQPATVQISQHHSKKDAKSAKGTAEAKVLKGTVSEDGKNSPFLPGVVQSIPKDTPVNITFNANFNSEISQKGDEVWVDVSRDVSNGKGVGVPGGWRMHGWVIDTKEQRNLGRRGSVTIEFDKLVSPDAQYELPFHAKFSTEDKKLTAVAKIVTKDAGIVSYGAAGGAILALQMGGVPLAVASHGGSIAIGAGVGASIGLVGALKRKGRVAEIAPGQVMKLITAEPIALPGFDKTKLPSAVKYVPLKDMAIHINRTGFQRDPMGDKDANLLWVDLTMKNDTEKIYAFSDLAVVSDMNKRYCPSIYGGMQEVQKRCEPASEKQGIVTFSVDDKKRKYWLVLLDRVHQGELTRVPLN